MTKAEKETELKARLRKILDEMGKPLAEADVFILRDAEMSAIRRKLSENPHFKGREARKIKKEKHVNVLSFPEPKGFLYPKGMEGKLGEIYLNGDMAKGDMDSLTYLLIHGALHLCGYVHYSKRDTMSMEKLERKLWHHVL